MSLKGKKKISKTAAVRFLGFAICCICVIAAFFFAQNYFKKNLKANESSSESERYPENKLYDTSAISEAYLTGDESSLSDFNRQILQKASQIIGEVISGEMDDYEKELAVHDYIISNCEYDESMLSAIGVHSKNAQNPYGALIEGKAICSGYTSSFQLMMDMLEIPCKSIYATDFTGGEHAWNMVEINNNWYYVDVTWDDPTPDVKNRPVRHKYFNVTEEYMKLKHEWDSSGFPQADSWEDSFIAKNVKKLDDFSQIKSYMEENLSKNQDSGYFNVDECMEKKLEIQDGIDEYPDYSQISPQLEEVLKELGEEYGEYKVSVQRVKFGSQTVLAVYMVKKR